LQHREKMYENLKTEADVYVLTIDFLGHTTLSLICLTRLCLLAWCLDDVAFRVS